MTVSKATGRESFEVHAPASGELLAKLPQIGAAEVEATVERARAAQPEWAGLGYAGRAKVMRALRGWLVRNQDELIETLVAEGGRVREDVLFGECFYCADSIGFWARNAPRYLRDRKVRSASPFMIGRSLKVRYEPLGVIGVIAPWNFPLSLGFGDAIPALMAGNSVALKPSSATPLSSLLVERGWREIGGPADVFSVLAGAGRVGSALVDNADMIMFTGSVETGRTIAERAARRLIPASLELGGKDPMIVCADADLDRASETAVRFAFWHSGQICMSTERAYVEAPVYDDFVRRIVERTRALRQASTTEPGASEVGAMVTDDQRDLVAAQIADAVKKGARVLTGGNPVPGPGRFFEPTVLVDVDHGMDVMREETFGPVLPVMKVGSAEEAVRLANDSDYGLNSSIFTDDLRRGLKLAEQLEAGNTCVNDAVLNAGIQAAPFGAMKESGLGTRNGPEGIRKYCRSHTILATRRVLPGSDLLGWPNRARVTRAIERVMRLLWGRRAR